MLTVEKIIMNYPMRRISLSVVQVVYELGNHVGQVLEGITPFVDTEASPPPWSVKGQCELETRSLLGPPRNDTYCPTLPGPVAHCRCVLPWTMAKGNDYHDRDIARQEYYDLKGQLMESMGVDAYHEFMEIGAQMFAPSQS